MVFIVIALSLFAVFFLWVLFVYGDFLRQVRNAKRAFLQTKKELALRYDVVTQLLQVVGSVVGEDFPVIQNLRSAQKVAMDTMVLSEKGKAEIALTEAIEALYIAVDSNQDVKKDSRFIELQTACEDIESRIRITRERYNEITQNIDIEMESFPGNIFAKISRYEKMQFFE